MKKIIIINNIISPLRVFLYGKMNDYYLRKGWKLKVIFLSETDRNRNWKKSTDIDFDYEVLTNFAIRTREKDLNTFFINLKIIDVLKKENPDKIICFGWDHFAAYAANRWARKNAKEFVLWSGSTEYEKSWRRTLFNPLVKYLIKRTDNFIAYGTRAKEYLVSLGAKEESVQIFYNTIDVDYFSENLKKISDYEKKELKRQLGISTSKVIIFSGRLLEMKGIFEMVEGFESFCKQDNDASLLIMGSGPDEERLKGIIDKQKIKNIYFTKFVQYKDLYKYYSISDLLLFPTRQDIWGLVVNEAMACGLPVIVTNVAGASADLIEGGKNGYIINLNSPKEITKGIETIFSRGLNKNNNSLEIIEKIKINKILKDISI